MRRPGHSPIGWAALILLVVVYQHTIIKIAIIAGLAAAAIALALSPALRLLLAAIAERRDQRLSVDRGAAAPHQLAMVAAAAKAYVRAHSDPSATPHDELSALTRAERQARAAGIPYQQVEEMTRKVLEHPGHWLAH